ncbi:hypothetical protein AMECASPLE_015711 [Ameca splendens]|uniref:Nuclear protein 1 n=1 Tax=Ameca splendens TaxID=208324 RepID=A0ABV1ABJ6_9TELE
MSHVDVKNLKLSKFEEEHYDEYDCYNLTDKYAGEETGFLLLLNFTRIITNGLSRACVAEGSARKGRTKKEASENTNRQNPAGHERKIVEKLQNSEKKAKE